MQLSAVVERARLVDPAGKPMEQVIEHRTDPLTGTVATINAALGEKARAFLGAADLELLRDLEARSRAGCPFCSASEKGTRFPPELVASGQLRVGRSIAVPNLFSKGAFDAVVIVDHEQHVLLPSRLPAASLATAIRAGADVVRRARAHDPALVHHVLGMNFLQPGGSSVPHPHFQVHVRGVPYSQVARLLELARGWRERSGRGYFEELLAHEERDGARYVGATGRVRWLAPFAPAHQKELWGVLPGTASLAALADEDAAGFADGIARAAAFYEKQGHHAFTLAFLSSPSPADAGHFALQVRLCARPAFKALYANYDAWFTPFFLGEDVHTEAPEGWARRLRERW